MHDRAQDVVAGDGTTTVTVLCGSLLSRCLGLLEKGVHPTLVSEAFQLASDKAVEVLKAMATPVDLGDREALVDAAMTCALTSLSDRACCRTAAALCGRGTGGPARPQVLTKGRRRAAAQVAQQQSRLAILVGLCADGRRRCLPRP